MVLSNYVFCYKYAKDAARDRMYSLDACFGFVRRRKAGYQSASAYNKDLYFISDEVVTGFMHSYNDKNATNVRTIYFTEKTSYR